MLIENSINSYVKNFPIVKYDILEIKNPSLWKIIFLITILFPKKIHLYNFFIDLL